MISTRSWSGDHDATMRCFSIVLSFGMLICGVEGSFPCKSEQIHWNDAAGKKYKCVDCPDCPVGSELSVPCGTSVKYGTPIHCISCKLGETYSKNYDKAQCRACTICSTGKTVIMNCTLSSNTNCSKKCNQGFYSVPFSFDCWPCSECCHDGKDELSAECAHSKKKCKMRSSPCIYVRTTNTPAATLVHKAPSSSQESQSLSSQRNTVTSLPKGEIKTRTSSAFNGYSAEPTKSGVDQSESTNTSTKSRKEDSGNEPLFILSTVSVVLGIALSLFACIILATRQFINGGFCRARFLRSANSNNADVFPLAQLNQATSVSQEQLKADDVTLEELESNNMDLFDWVCTRLDNGRSGFRRDYERLASKYTRIPLEVRNSLKNELRSEGGSPSKLLMSHLHTLYPNHPLRYLVRMLKEIGRNDIAQKLTPHMQKNVEI